MQHKPIRTLRRRISRKNQVALPVIFLQRLRIIPGRFVSIEEHAEGIIIKPASDPISSARGFLSRGKASAKKIKEEIRREEKRNEREKFKI